MWCRSCKASFFYISISYIGWLKFYVRQEKGPGSTTITSCQYTKRKRKQTKPNKRKSNECMKGTQISSLFPKRGRLMAKSSFRTSAVVYALRYMCVCALKSFQSEYIIFISVGSSVKWGCQTSPQFSVDYVLRSFVIMEPIPEVIKSI